MAKLADHIHIEAGRLTIDGEEFPWFLSEDGPTVNGLTHRDIGTVTVTILADRVTVDHLLSSGPRTAVDRDVVERIRAAAEGDQG